MYAATKRSSEKRDFKGTQFRTCGAFESLDDLRGHPPRGNEGFHGRGADKSTDGLAALGFGVFQPVGHIGKRRMAFPPRSVLCGPSAVNARHGYSLILSYNHGRHCHKLLDATSRGTTQWHPWFPRKCRQMSTHCILLISAVPL